MTRFRDVYPTTPAERLCMFASYALVALGFVMVTNPEATGAAITKAAMAVVGVFA